MKILSLLRLLKQFGPLCDPVWSIVQDLMAVGSVPDVDNKDALRAWLKHLSEIGGKAADMTPVALDDQLVDGVEFILDTKEAWDIVHACIVAGVGDGQYDDLDAASQVVAVMDASDAPKAGAFSIGTILVAINAVLQLIEWFKDRRGR